MPLGRAAQPGAGAQRRRPGRLLLIDHQPAQGVQVAADCAVVQRAPVAAGVGRDGADADRGRGVPRQRAQHPAHVFRIAPDTVRAGNVDPADFLQIVGAGGHAGAVGAPAVAGPAAAAELHRCLLNRQAGIRATLKPAAQQRPQRYLARGEAHLPQGHRAQPQAGDTPRPRVAGDVVGRHRGAGQDEPPPVRAPVHFPPDMVPQGRLDLPLVDQPGRLPGQHQGWGRRRRAARILVHVQQHLAGRHPTGHGRLAAGAGALDQHRAGGFQPVREFRVADPRVVPALRHRSAAAARPIVRKTG